MAEEKITLSKKDRRSVALRSTFLQGSWNYERMQNGGWCFAMIPAIKKLYTNKEDRSIKTSSGILQHTSICSFSCTWCNTCLRRRKSKRCAGR